VSASPTAADIEEWMVSYVCRVLNVEKSKVDPSRYFNQNGLDSMLLIAMTEELGSWLGQEIEPTLAYDHPSIKNFSAHLAKRFGSAA
jgi:acyl carrier protein